MFLSGKIAMITGSSRGIGRATACILAKNGANIIIHYNSNKKKAEETLAMVESFCVAGEIFHADMSDKQQIADMVNKANSVFGGIDILVNNAGIRRDGLMLTMRDETWNEVIVTNLNSVFHTCKLVGKQMVKQKSGVIVNVSSLSGVSGRMAQTNYAASKAGVIALTKSLALELARWNIRVNAVVPGMIKTDMTDDLDPDVIDALTIPLGRMGTADEVAQCVLFLASEMSSYITGSTINVNGGVYT